MTTRFSHDVSNSELGLFYLNKLESIMFQILDNINKTKSTSAQSIKYFNDTLNELSKMPNYDQLAISKFIGCMRALFSHITYHQPTTINTDTIKANITSICIDSIPDHATRKHILERIHECPNTACSTNFIIARDHRIKYYTLSEYPADRRLCMEEGYAEGTMMYHLTCRHCKYATLHCEDARTACEEWLAVINKNKSSHMDIATVKSAVHSILDTQFGKHANDIARKVFKSISLEYNVDNPSVQAKIQRMCNVSVKEQFHKLFDNINNATIDVKVPSSKTLKLESPSVSVETPVLSSTNVEISKIDEAAELMNIYAEKLNGNTSKNKYALVREYISKLFDILNATSTYRQSKMYYTLTKLKLFKFATHEDTYAEYCKIKKLSSTFNVGTVTNIVSSALNYVAHYCDSKYLPEIPYGSHWNMYKDEPESYFDRVIAFLKETREYRIENMKLIENTSSHRLNMYESNTSQTLKDMSCNNYEENCNISNNKYTLPDDCTMLQLAEYTEKRKSLVDILRIIEQRKLISELGRIYIKNNIAANPERVSDILATVTTKAVLQDIKDYIAILSELKDNGGYVTHFYNIVNKLGKSSEKILSMGDYLCIMHDLDNCFIAVYNKYTENSHKLQLKNIFCTVDTMLQSIRSELRGRDFTEKARVILSRIEELLNSINKHDPITMSASYTYLQKSLQSFKECTALAKFKNTEFRIMQSVVVAMKREYFTQI